MAKSSLSVASKTYAAQRHTTAIQRQRETTITYIADGRQRVAGDELDALRGKLARQKPFECQTNPNEKVELKAASPDGTIWDTDGLNNTAIYHVKALIIGELSVIFFGCSTSCFVVVVDKYL